MSNPETRQVLSEEDTRSLVRELFMDASVEYAAALREGDDAGAAERLDSLNIYLDLFRDLGGLAVEDGKPRSTA